MRVVYILDSISTIGGLNRILIEKMNFLANYSEEKFEIYLVTAYSDSEEPAFPLSPKVRRIGLDICLHKPYRHRFPLRLYYQIIVRNEFRKKLQETISKINPEIIIGTATFEGATISKLKTDAIKIIESHGNRKFKGVTWKDNFCKKQIKKAINHFYFKDIESHCNLLVTLTEADRETWKSCRKTITIPNFTESIPMRHPKPSKKMVSAGTLTYPKNFIELIEAWSIVSKKHPEWTLDIFGSGPDLKELEDRIKTLHQENRITIFPATKDFKNLLPDYSAFILCTKNEGFPMVLIESMMRAVPCIASDIEFGPNEIIHDKFDGLLFEEGNVNDLVEKINVMIGMVETSDKLRENAHSSALRYSEERIMSMWISTFKMIAH